MSEPETREFQAMKPDLETHSTWLSMHIREEEILLSLYTNIAGGSGFLEKTKGFIAINTKALPRYFWGSFQPKQL